MIIQFSSIFSGVPTRPTIRKVVPKGSEINIVWSYGDDGGKKINSVIIEYGFTKAIRWESVFIQNYPQVQQYTFKTLRPYTSYKFRVYAVNEIGKSSASVMRFGTTQLGMVYYTVIFLNLTHAFLYGNGAYIQEWSLYITNNQQTAELLF